MYQPTVYTCRETKNVTRFLNHINITEVCVNGLKSVSTVVAEIRLHIAAWWNDMFTYHFCIEYMIWVDLNVLYEQLDSD